MPKKKVTSIVIDELLCKGCDICIELCGKDVFDKSEKINRHGYYIPVPVRVNACTGCLICELICPELAVILVMDKERETVS